MLKSKRKLHEFVEHVFTAFDTVGSLNWYFKSSGRLINPLKVVTNEKGEAVGEVVTIIC
jgi:hypothetical protein